MDNYFLRSSCSTKKRYPDEKVATKIANKKGYERGVKLRVYGCTLCGGWHMTKTEDKGASK